jgi:hypothetical protein
MNKVKAVWISIVGVCLVFWFIANIPGWKIIIPINWNHLINGEIKEIFWTSRTALVAQYYGTFYAILSILVGRIILPIITLTAFWSVLSFVLNSLFGTDIKLVDIFRGRTKVREQVAVKEPEVI